jgi:hypothetical protein
MKLGPEAQIQAAIVEHLAKRGRPGVMALAPCNEGKRSPAAAAYLRKLGMYPGAADLCVIVPEEPVLFLELKAKGGKPSPEQLAFGTAIQVAGHAWRCVDNIDDALALLEQWGAIRRQARRAA